MAEKENQPQELPHKHLSSSPDQVYLGGTKYIPEKSEWPEAVGLTAEEAQKKIKEEAASGTEVHVVPSDSFVTMDFRMDRVRIFVDTTGKVVKPPRIG